VSYAPSHASNRQALISHISGEDSVNSSAKRQTIVRKPLLTALLDPSKTTQRVKIKQIDFFRGQATGLHYHPCPVVGYVVSGSVTFQVEDEPQKTLHTVDAFLEPPNKKMLHFDNASTTEPMTFIAFYLLDKQDHELIHMLE
jgi:quercetin dioxygenase-like cupin family protein